MKLFVISGVMCLKICSALHALWGMIYTAAGSIQLVAGIFFLLSLPVFRMGSNIATGACVSRTIVKRTVFEQGRHTKEEKRESFPKDFSSRKICCPLSRMSKG